MNTSQIKSFAIESRKVLKAGVMNRIQALGFSAEGEPTMGQPTKIQGATVFAGRMFEESFYDKWMGLYERIQRKGVKEIYEEAAYTWFNRLVAIRIMQKNGFIEPVLAYSSEETRIPRIVAEARAGRLPHQMSSEERSKLIELLSDDTKVNEQFALLIENFCKTDPVIFNCFGGIEHHISLLLPDNILVPGGFIDLLNHTSYISDDDYKQSELIGWLYQFYISEKKDEVFDSFKNGKKAEAEDIPAATQIFTPNWIVKYMVQNTIGRIYLDNNPYSCLAESMKYLVKTDEPTPKEAILHIDDLAEYKMIDPACGSGHILVEGFDLFFQMYKEEGYASHAAIENIFRKNLIGIDLDTRAKQLATFALLMKAARIDQSFLDCKIMPRVLDMPRPCTEFKYDLTNTLSQFFMSTDKPLINETVKAFELLKQADNLGSIMKFDMLSDRTRAEIALRYKEIAEFSNVSDQIKEILPSIKLILALTDKYSAVVANPPYMGCGNMNHQLAHYLELTYPYTKYDLFSAFMSLGLNITWFNGKMGMINMQSWMFLISFEELRKQLVRSNHIDSLVYLGRGVFGNDFGTVSFVTSNVSACNNNISWPGYYYKLTEAQDSNEKEALFSSFIFSPIKWRQYSFLLIPGCTFAFWLNEKWLSLFSHPSIEKYVYSKAGTVTGNDKYFIREWFEINFTKIAFQHTSSDSFSSYHPFQKGGLSRRFAGNDEYLIKLAKLWDNNYYNSSIRRGDRDSYFKTGISWSMVNSSGLKAFRIIENSVCGVASPTIFPNKENDSLLYILGFLNGKIARELLNILNPTINLLTSNVCSLPLIISNDVSYKNIIEYVKDCVKGSKEDWDTHETSWDFQQNELLRIAWGNGLSKLEKAVNSYRTVWESRFDQLHENEEELNRQFIEIYGLQDELTPDVPLDEITILQAGEITHVKDESEYGGGHYVWNYDNLMKQLLSYAVGCMMGRYRLDRPGLAIAYPNPSADDIAPYEYNGMTFNIDDDGIIPLMDRSCPFEDNAYNRTVKFIKQVFGEENQNENLNFLETSLGTSIENYLVKDFWKDHKKMYQNRPIYWLFSSKKGAFQCLVYMHRMNAYTAETVRSKYLLPYIDYLKTNIANQTEHASLLSTVDRKALAKMQKDLDECLEYEERLHDIADRQIAFDLDDGVVVNYAKFGDVLAKIK